MFHKLRTCRQYSFPVSSDCKITRTATDPPRKKQIPAKGSPSPWTETMGFSVTEHCGSGVFSVVGLNRFLIFRNLWYEFWVNQKFEYDYHQVQLKKEKLSGGFLYYVYYINYFFGGVIGKVAVIHPWCSRIKAEIDSSRWELYRDSWVWLVLSFQNNILLWPFFVCTLNLCKWQYDFKTIPDIFIYRHIGTHN